DLDAGHAARVRSCADDDFGRLEGSRRIAGHVDTAGAGQPGGHFHPRDVVLLEEVFDALREPYHDLRTPRTDAGHVDAGSDVAARHAPLLRVLRDFHSVRVLKQRLRWNAAPVQAGSAQRWLPFDDRDLQTELRAPDGRNVPAGAGADDHHV